MTISQRRVSTLFSTAMIIFFVGILLFVALLNVSRGGHDLLILSLLVIVMMGGLKLWTAFSHSKIGLRQVLDKVRVFAGEEMTLTINAQNGKALPVWLEVEIPVGDGGHARLFDAPLTAQRSLLWYQITKFRWSFVAAHRGVHTIGPIQASSGDLFGFFVRQQSIGEATEVIVYPKLLPLNPITLPKRDFFGVPGGESPVNDPVYILGTADYQYGRPAKYIHWKASARHHRLQEKIFESTEQEKVLLIVDVGQFTDADTQAFERSLEVAASLAVKFDRQGCAIGMLTNGAIVGGTSAFVSVARSARQVPAILEVLARLEMKPRATLLEVLRDSLEIPWGTSCVYITRKEDYMTRMVKEYGRSRRTPVTVITCEGMSLLRRDGQAQGAYTSHTDGPVGVRVERT
ncbi:MAG TPA: DUF58 domain-containing protein [Syntrophorhabdaceae bacterium]|nr:DUF58 domain-containing protein [Syntrophorhabdaceae bacterium]